MFFDENNLNFFYDKIITGFHDDDNININVYVLEILLNIIDKLNNYDVLEQFGDKINYLFFNIIQKDHDKLGMFLTLIFPYYNILVRYCPFDIIVQNMTNEKISISNKIKIREFINLILEKTNINFDFHIDKIFNQMINFSLFLNKDDFDMSNTTADDFIPLMKLISKEELFNIYSTYSNLDNEEIVAVVIPLFEAIFYFYEFEQVAEYFIRCLSIDNFQIQKLALDAMDKYKNSSYFIDKISFIISFLIEHFYIDIRFFSKNLFYFIPFCDNIIDFFPILTELISKLINCQDYEAIISGLFIISAIVSKDYSLISNKQYIQLLISCLNYNNDDIYCLTYSIINIIFLHDPNAFDDFIQYFLDVSNVYSIRFLTFLLDCHKEEIDNFIILNIEKIITVCNDENLDHEKLILSLNSEIELFIYYQFEQLISYILKMIIIFIKRNEFKELNKSLTRLLPFLNDYIIDFTPIIHAFIIEIPDKDSKNLKRIIKCFTTILKNIGYIKIMGNISSYLVNIMKKIINNFIHDTFLLHPIYDFFEVLFSFNELKLPNLLMEIYNSSIQGLQSQNIDIMTYSQKLNALSQKRIHNM